MDNPHRRDDLHFGDRGCDPFTMRGPQMPRAVTFSQEDVRSAIDLLVTFAHSASRSVGWYHDLETGEPISFDKTQGMMLIVREVSEAFEGYRRNAMDDKLPHRLAEEVEMADAFLRLLNYAGANRLDLAGATVEKSLYNLTREDHKPASRLAHGGKIF